MSTRKSVVEVERTVPLTGLRVVEYAPGLTQVGAGAVISLPGAILRDFGAQVTRFRETPVSLDYGVEQDRARDHGKVVVDVRDTDRVAELVARADVLFIAGEERVVEQQGLGYEELAQLNPGLVYSRVRSSRNARGPIPDYELLVHARVGLLTQVQGNRPGPVFVDLGLAAAGAAAQATVGALVLLYERERTGRGGWCETSLYDGLLALVPLLVGRAERPTPSTRSIWERTEASICPSFRCADGEYLQPWLGAAGAYEAFLVHIGDPPSEAGYSADLASGAFIERTKRWAGLFAGRERSFWLDDLAGQAFRCEPVLRPGEVLADEQVRAVGLSVKVADENRGPIRVVGPPGSVFPQSSLGNFGDVALGSSTGPLSGTRVLDLAAFGAGPFAARILAELGADVIKVEPTSGDAHRHVEPMFAGVQRNKRAIALNLKSPDAARVLDKLFRWSDVVHHSARLGRAEQLGYDEALVRASNPDVVYVHASGWGPTGPRSHLPANDQLMQALSGISAAAGGPGLQPVVLPGGPVDKFSGWLTACSILVGLYARRRQGRGQTVLTSLLGAALTLKSGAFLCTDGTAVNGPTVDERQTGYGAAYRIYEAKDGRWVALAVPDPVTWQRFWAAVAAQATTLPVEPPPLRLSGAEPQHVEKALEDLFSTKPAAEWIATLGACDVPVELVIEPNRQEFVGGILDDPVTRQLGRSDSFVWGRLGRVDHLTVAPRFGPQRRAVPMPFVAELGQHTREVLMLVGLDPDVDELLANGTVATGDGSGR